MGGKFARGQVLGPWWTSKQVLNHEIDGETRNKDPISAESLARSLRTSMLTLKSKYMAEDGSSVNYDALKESQAFKEYVRLAADLKRISLLDLSPAARKAFLINIYNSLCIHAITEGLLSTFPGGSLSRLKLYAKASYQIGSEVFSLNDIENGILRNNKPSAAPWARSPFKEGDPRLTLCIECDPRIHFALNCAANSCPPISVYDMEDEQKLDAQLDLATKGFLSREENVQLGPNNSVKLSMLMSWYASDFADSKSGILTWVAENTEDATQVQLRSILKDESVSIEYLDYDWGVNTS